MLEKIFDVRLWSQLIDVIGHVIFVSTIYKKYQSSLFYSIYFQYLLSIFSLVTFKRMFLLKSVCRNYLDLLTSRLKIFLMHD